MELIEFAENKRRLLNVVNSCEQQMKHYGSSSRMPSRMFLSFFLSIDNPGMICCCAGNTPMLLVRLLLGRG